MCGAAGGFGGYKTTAGPGSAASDGRRIDMATAYQRNVRTTTEGGYAQNWEIGPTAKAVRDARFVLRFAFTVVPIIAGLDKLFYAVTDKWLLVDWYQYLLPGLKSAGVDDFVFSVVVGVVEIVAGLIVAFRPDFGGYLVMAWLWGIIINFLLIPGYYDIALRDFGLSLCALSTARLWWPRYHDRKGPVRETGEQEPTREFASPPQT
jgi:hypothetical protein